MKALCFDTRMPCAADSHHPLARLAARLRDTTDRIDDATGAPNQSKGFDCGVDLLEHLDATGGRGGFAVIEVLNASRIYTYGGAQSNQALWTRVLQAVAQALPANAYCIRISPGIAIHAFGDAVTDCMTALLERIRTSLRSLTIETQIDDQVVLVPLELKVGYVIYPDDAGKVSFARVSSAAAMAALNLDLLHCHARVRRYSRELAAELSEIGRPEASLIRSIDNGDIELHYQPQVDMLIGRPISAKALARWTSPGFRVGLNLSQGVFHGSPCCVLPLLRDQVDEEPARARRLSIELTESAYFNKTCADNLVQLKREIKSMGIRLAVDVFGSGYGALHLLAENVVDAVKLGVGIVKAICDGDLRSIFVRKLVCSAALTRFDIVAEGIEEPLQERKMLLHGVPFGQGCRYSPALPERAFLAYLQRFERGTAAQAWPAQALS